MEKLITSIQSQCSHRKKFLWKRRALKKMDQPCQKAAPLIYWRSVVFPVFFSLLLFCVESHIVLARLSITKPSFPGRAAQTYHSLLMQFWCQSEVVFWLYLKDFFWSKKNQQTLALANFTMRTWTFAMFSNPVWWSPLTTSTTLWILDLGAAVQGRRFTVFSEPRSGLLLLHSWVSWW